MTWSDETVWTATAIAFLLGTLLGRFLLRCIDRFPRHETLGEQLAAPFRSSTAERTLRGASQAGHWIPVVGWLLPGHPFSQGWQRNLGRAAVELANGLLCAALVAVEFPRGAELLDPFAVPGLAFLAPATGSATLQLVRLALHLFLVQSLLVASVIDLEKMIIPDGSTLPAMLLGLLVSTAAGGIWLVPLWYEDTGLIALLDLGGGFDGGVEVPAFLVEHPHLHGFLVSLCGLIVGGGTVWAVRLIGHWALGREAMGFGDVILMAMIGSVVGWQPVLTVFFLAPLCAVFVVLFAALTGASREFPYGPWLALATVLLLVGWSAIWPYAGRFFLMGRLIPIVGFGAFILLAVLLRGMRLIRGDQYWYDPHGAWSSADQLHYQSQENAGARQQAWKDRHDNRWPGIASGQGTYGETQWRSPPPAAPWRLRLKP